MSKTFIELSIEGMNCGSCARKIEQAISDIPSVTGQTINLRTKRLEAYVDNESALAELMVAVAGAGYRAVPNVSPDLEGG